MRRPNPKDNSQEEPQAEKLTKGLEVGGSGSQHDLMCVNLLLFDDERYVAEVLLA